MDQQPPNYRREFFRSKHHAWLGVTTLGLGFVLGASLPIFLLGGAAAYALGWIYLPDMGFFKRYVDGQRDAARQAAAAAELAGFQLKRDALHASLTPRLRARYNELSEVCHQIEHATADDAMSHSGTTDPRLSRLDDLMWTYLRLLSLDNSLERFLEIERREDVPGRIRDAETSRDRRLAVSDRDTGDSSSGAIAGGIKRRARRRRAQRGGPRAEVRVQVAALSRLQKGTHAGGRCDRREGRDLSASSRDGKRRLVRCIRERRLRFDTSLCHGQIEPDSEMMFFRSEVAVGEVPR